LLLFFAIVLLLLFCSLSLLKQAQKYIFLLAYSNVLAAIYFLFFVRYFLRLSESDGSGRAEATLEAHLWCAWEREGAGADSATHAIDV
jgi:hypothetical protein